MSRCEEPLEMSVTATCQTMTSAGPMLASKASPAHFVCSTHGLLREAGAGEGNNLFWLFVL